MVVFRKHTVALLSICIHLYVYIYIYIHTYRYVISMESMYVQYVSAQSLLGCDLDPPRVADLSQADRKLLVKRSRTSATWHEFLNMVLQIGKCFKVFPNMAWHHKTPTTKMHKNPSSPPRRGFRKWLFVSISSTVPALCCKVGAAS